MTLFGWKKHNDFFSKDNILFTLSRIIKNITYAPAVL